MTENKLRIMSREIKFRGWFEPSLQVWPEHPNGHFQYFTGIEDAGYWADSGSCVLQQYTGLKDKNGKEIYDGDIVQYASYEPPVIIGYHKVGYGDDIRLCMLNLITGKPEDDFYGGIFHLEDMEVIGNIYENPELINTEPNDD